jgi:SAM-dependent methyltransferase
VKEVVAETPTTSADGNRFARLTPRAARPVACASVQECPSTARACEDSSMPDSRHARTWELDELSHAGQEHLDATYVEGYDQKSPTDWTEDVAELQALGIGASSTVVDLGAGTGTFAEAIAPYVQRVVAVDVSEPMVAKMRERGIEAVQAGFLTYEHQGEPPDAVVTRNALHHLSDFWKALALSRIAQMLRPDGVLLLRDVVFSFPLREASSSIQIWLDSAPTDPARGWTPAQLAEHVRTEHSTFTWLLEPMLLRAGFEVRTRFLSDDGIYAAYTCVRV